MNPNMSIYRWLNPKLLVQVGVVLGLLHWANMFNISLKPSFKLKVEAWWRFEISMRRSLGDASKYAFKEFTMKNVPIDQIWSFKRRNGVQNQNLREKLSKIGFFEKFDFWSNVNAKAKVNSQHLTKVNGRVKVNSDQSMVYIVWVDFEFFELGHGLGCRAGDVVLMTWRWPGLRLMWLGLAWRYRG